MNSGKIAQYFQINSFGVEVSFSFFCFRETSFQDAEQQNQLIGNFLVLVQLIDFLLDLFVEIVVLLEHIVWFERVHKQEENVFQCLVVTVAIMFE